MMMMITMFREGAENGGVWFTGCHHSWQTRTLQIVLLVRLKTLCPECLFSHIMQCGDYDCTLSHVTCSTSKNSAGSDMANVKAVIPSILFCHKCCSV